MRIYLVNNPNECAVQQREDNAPSILIPQMSALGIEDLRCRMWLTSESPFHQAESEL